MTWQTIDTAPKDGTPILIFDPTAGEHFGPRMHHMPEGALKSGECSYALTDPRLQWFDDRRWAIGYWSPSGRWGNRNSHYVNPTHWMHLPPPPLDGGGAG